LYVFIFSFLTFWHFYISSCRQADWNCNISDPYSEDGCFESRPEKWSSWLRFLQASSIVLVEALDTALQHSVADIYPEISFLFT
jgi:hypothetical protein